MGGCKVSVIVPVYNAAAFIPQTMGNLFYQSLIERGQGEMEIILVNDASTDGSGRMLEDLYVQFPDRVRVFQLEEHEGAGGARNAGLAAAAGEYVGFMDADDMVDPTLYEKLYAAGVGDGAAVSGGFAGYDIVDSPLVNVREKKRTLYTPPSCWGALTAEKKTRLLALPGIVGTRIYRRAFLESYGARFYANAYTGEDAAFLQIAAANAVSVTGIREPLYFYKNAEGAVLPRTDDSGRINESMQEVLASYQALAVLPDYEGFRPGAESYYMKVFADDMWLIRQQLRQGMLTQELAEGFLTALEQVYHMAIRSKIAESPYIESLIAGDEIKMLKEMFET